MQASSASNSHELEHRQQQVVPSLLSIIEQQRAQLQEQGSKIMQLEAEVEVRGPLLGITAAPTKAVHPPI